MTDVPLPHRPDQLIREQLIAALVPQTTTPRPAAAPLAALPSPALPGRTEQGPVHIATCILDRSGRVNAAALLAALAWQPGDRLDVDIGLPAAARTMCRLQPGQPVLLAALTDHGVLAVHPAAAITRLLARQHHRLLEHLQDRRPG